MTDYVLYKSRNSVTPFVTVDAGTVDTTHTSVFLVGQTVLAYGTGEQQSKLWILENFANSTAPIQAILGQEWFNTTDGKMYACVNETGPVWQKVSAPLVSSSPPAVSLTLGDLWYNSTTGQLFAWNGSTWGTAIGPTASIPTSSQIIQYLTITTADATPVEMWVSGVSNSRMVLPIKTSWLYDIKLIGRVQGTESTVRAVSFSRKSSCDV